MFVNVEHPVAGHTTLTGDQIKFSDWDQKVRMPAPVLGQHNEEVYGKMLGLTKAQIEQLKQNHVL
jgi:formyl-CoA transferase